MDRDHYVSYLREEANYEVARLESLLRDPRITQEERDVAMAMLEFYSDAKLQPARRARSKVRAKAA